MPVWLRGLWCAVLLWCLLIHEDVSVVHVVAEIRGGTKRVLHHCVRHWLHGFIIKEQPIVVALDKAYIVPCTREQNEAVIRRVGVRAADSVDISMSPYSRGNWLNLDCNLPWFGPLPTWTTTAKRVYSESAPSHSSVVLNSFSSIGKTTR